MYPKDYRYTKEHEWIRADGAIGTIGITDYAQHELGDVVFVELPKVGTQLKAGQSLGTIESVKAVSEIFTPVSGEVTETNPALVDAPEKINSDLHGAVERRERLGCMKKYLPRGGVNLGGPWPGARVHTR